VPVLLATVFLDVAGFGIILPLQPFFALQLGATPDLVTLVAAGYTAAQFIAVPFWGRQSDRWGRRPVLLVLLAGSATASLCLAFVDSLPLLFAARACAGAVAGNILLSHAWVTDTTAPERRARHIGLVGAASGLGFACGPAIGGLLAGPSGAADAFQLPFLAAAALSALSFALALVGLRESAPAARRADRPARRESRLAGLRRYLARPQFGLILALAFMSPFVFSGMETVFALWSERVWGWGPDWNGYAYAFMGGAAVVTQGLLVGPLNAVLPAQRVILLGGASALAGLLWLVAAGSTAEVFAALAAVIFGVGVAMNALTTLISTYAAPGERGTLLGVGQLASGSGRILGPALSGPLFAHAGDAAPFLVGAAVMAAMIGLGARLRPLQSLDVAAPRD
jgi:DHA1 family tetracycline resistance protein-like MFS transporter